MNTLIVIVASILLVLWFCDIKPFANIKTSLSPLLSKHPNDIGSASAGLQLYPSSTYYPANKPVGAPFDISDCKKCDINTCDSVCDATKGDTVEYNNCVSECCGRSCINCCDNNALFQCNPADQTCYAQNELCRKSCISP